MQVLLNNGYVSCFSLNGSFVNGIVTNNPNDFEHFSSHYMSYKLEGDQLVYDNEKGQEDNLNALKDELRRQRETECFKIINRGKLWYDSITSEQADSLRSWYEQWLDVTDTLVIPSKLDWV